VSDLNRAEQLGQARKFELLAREAKARGLDSKNLDKRATQARANAKGKK
jgi:hypothetical protein